jgi:hypothetical protein
LGVGVVAHEGGEVGVGGEAFGQGDDAGAAREGDHAQQVLTPGAVGRLDGVAKPAQGFVPDALGHVDDEDGAHPLRRGGAGGAREGHDEQRREGRAEQGGQGALGGREVGERARGPERKPGQEREEVERPGLDEAELAAEVFGQTVREGQAREVDGDGPGGGSEAVVHPQRHERPGEGREGEGQGAAEGFAGVHARGKALG